jgi:electron transport complex protein RnfD
MSETAKLIVSHAPFWHFGNSIAERSRHTLLAALPAVLFGIGQYGAPALAVICFSVATAMLWELAMNRAMRSAVTIGDGNAAVIGLLLGMMLPAGAPWWLVLVGTFLAVIVGKQIFGGLGGNAFNPVLVALTILALSWERIIDFNSALLSYDMSFPMYYPLAALKHHGPAAVASITPWDLLLGRQPGGIGATFGLGLLLGGAYLILRGFIRWEISLSYIAGVVVTAWLFQMADGARYGSPAIHLFSGYTLLAAFFLLTEDSSSPVNLLPMLLYGLGGGVLTILIRNIGAYPDGVPYAVLVMNMLNPLLDKIRPKSIGKVA